MKLMIYGTLFKSKTASTMGHSIYNAYVIGDHVYLKDDWATFVYRIKLLRHVKT